MILLFKKVESKLLTKLFMKWIKDEYDLELLAMTRSLIYEREIELKTLIDKINYKPINGYKL